MKKIVIIISFLAVVLSSCDNFLDIKPKGVIIPESIEDYDLLMTPILKNELENELFLLADDFQSSDSDLGDFNDKDNQLPLLYTFSKQVYGNPNTPAVTWNSPYERIYVYNKIINEIDKAKLTLGYSEADKKVIKAEAQYGRAVQYFLLVNFYAKHYSKASASSDNGVPLVLEANTAQESPEMSTVEQVYAQIIKDLNESLKGLTKLQKSLNRPNIGAGYALLARIYLYQANYDKAIENANLALKQNAVLGDYTKLGAAKANDLYDQEQFAHMFFGYPTGHYSGHMSKEALDLFDPTDIRVTKFYGCTWVNDPNTGWYKDCNLKQQSYSTGIRPNVLPSTGEMYIILAESYARKKNKNLALSNLNELRKKRIPGVVDKTSSDFANDDELLKFILVERRREMMPTGTRLFDLKRLNLEPKFAKTVVHSVEGKNYEAKPNAGKLVLPIPAQILAINPKLK